MSIAKQRLILIFSLGAILFVHTISSWFNRPFPCEALRNSRAFSLDFGTMNEIGRRDVFAAWAKVDADENTFRDYRSFVAWDANEIHHVAYYEGAEITHIELHPSPGPDVQTIINCFGLPSASSNIAFATDIGMYSQTLLWYDRLRVIVRGVEPTDVPAGTILPLDENAEASSIILYSPDAYEREKH